MVGDKQEKQPEIKDRDALDTLRRWVDRRNDKSASLEPILTIQEGKVERVKIKQGALTITLKAGDPV